MNKQKAIVAILLLIFILPTTSIAKEEINLVINNKPVPTDVRPYIKNARTIVPARFIVESFGGTIRYNKKDKPRPSVIITTPDEKRQIIMYINDPNAYVKDINYRSDLVPMVVSPTIENNRVMVPLRFLEDYLNFESHWDETTKTVNIYTPIEKVEEPFLR